jgi:hypothetical protein
MDARSLKLLFILLLLFAVATGVVLCAEAPSTGGTGERSSKTHTRLIPKYSIERKTRLKIGLMIHVSIAPSDVQEAKLVALARKLGEKYRKEEAFFLFIFDDPKGAREYQFAPVEVLSGEAQNSVRAMYGFVRPDTQAHFTWYPVRGDKAQFRKIHLDTPPYPK